MTFLAWLAGTKAGRWTMAVATFLVALFFAILKIFSAGEAAEKSKQDKAAIDAVKQKVKSDENIDRLSADDRRQRLRKWGYRR